MPTECPHGRIVDWGDFGPDPDDGTVGVEACERCDAYRAIVDETRGLLERASDAQRDAFDRWSADFLLAYALGTPLPDRKDYWPQAPE